MKELAVPMPDKQEYLATRTESSCGSLATLKQNNAPTENSGSKKLKAEII
jgi:hypothetical protein